MTAARCSVRAATMAFAAASAAASAAEPDAKVEAETTFAITGFYYAMRDQPDFTVGVASLNHGSLHLEARYNYEARDAGSVFAGWKFAGGDAVTFEVTPIVGALFGAARGVVPGIEASVAYGTLDAYVEAEYVHDLDQHSASYYYAWSELGGSRCRGCALASSASARARSRTAATCSAGPSQLFIDKVTLGIYAFNPDAGSRYVVVSLERSSSRQPTSARRTFQALWQAAERGVACACCSTT